MNDDWPFDQERDVAALTTRQVLEDDLPVLYVVHYSDDHSWAFTCGTSDDTDDLRIVCMSHIVDQDPALKFVADLEPGWVAVRDEVGEAWQRYQDDEM